MEGPLKFLVHGGGKLATPKIAEKLGIESKLGRRKTCITDEEGLKVITWSTVAWPIKI